MSESSFLILRWLARLSALLEAGALFLLIAGEMLAPHSRPPTYFTEWFGVGLLVVAAAGMLLAWVWELPGALLSLACLACWVAVVRTRHYGPIAVLAVPGLLFLADWLLRRHAKPVHEYRSFTRNQ
jgi:hypothetical protein